MRLLAVGNSVRHLAQSARDEVVAVDEFCDLDTRSHAERCLQVEEISEESISEAVSGLEFDAAVTTSPNVPTSLPLVGNSVEEMREAGDKLRFAEFCERHGFPHPETGREPASGRQLAKPRTGGGGRFNVETGGEEVPKEVREEAEAGFVYQEYVGGEAVSVSLLADGDRAEAVSVNRTLSGVEASRPPGDHIYCGNVTPYAGEGAEPAVSLSEELVEALGLRGSVGVDLILGGDGPVVLEVNPRLQASLDTVEAVHGVEVVERHVQASRGEPGWDEGLDPLSPDGAACRLVLYAPEDVVAPQLSTEGLRDVPPQGRSVEEGEPLVSVFREAGAPGEAMELAEAAAEEVYGELGLDS